MARPPGPGRGQLLDAAADLFAERGFAATSTQAIAERAGVSSGSIFYHFSSKDGLLGALMAERGFAPDLDRALAEIEADDPVQLLVAVGRALLSATAERDELLRISLQGAVLAGEHGDWLRELLGEKVGELARALVAAGVDERRARVAARALLSSLVVHGALVPVDGSAEAFVTDLAEALVGDTRS